MSAHQEWEVRLAEGVAESEHALVRFRRSEDGVLVYFVKPRKPGVDERWAAEVAASARVAVLCRLALQVPRPDTPSHPATPCAH